MMDRCNAPVMRACHREGMTHKVQLNQDHPRVDGRGPTTLGQLNAEYVSRINRVLEQGREDLARELAEDFATDRDNLPRS
jgi:hypothetical protein